MLFDVHSDAMTDVKGAHLEKEAFYLTCMTALSSLLAVTLNRSDRHNTGLLQGYISKIWCWLLHFFIGIRKNI